MLDDITWDRLQGIGLSRMSGSRSGFPEWQQTNPPSFGEMADHWRLGAAARDKAARRSDDERKAAIRADIDARAGRRLAPRLTNEEPDDFYRRVAGFYKASMVREGKPTSAIAESAGVPKTTAARWVREARQRNFLPPTTKGRSRS